MCDIAAECGEVQVLKIAHNLGCIFTYETGLTAARNDRYDCLRFCYEVLDEDFGEVLCQRAAVCGQVGVLKFARDLGILCTRRYAMTAIKKGHLESLELILDSIDAGHESDGESVCSEEYVSEDESKCTLGGNRTRRPVRRIAGKEMPAKDSISILQCVFAPRHDKGNRIFS